MVVTFVLGFIAAWHRDLGRNDASILNRMVLLYAVPLALFVGTVTTSRAALSQDIPLGYRIVRRHYCPLRFGVSLLPYHLPRPNERQRAARAGGIRASSAFRGPPRPR